MKLINFSWFLAFISTLNNEMKKVFLYKYKFDKLITRYVLIGPYRLVVVIINKINE